ncbi:hypothetical protein ABW20_dc0100517 [Dactylellina cionopaga]|nr:hypothetical protein ABW20_dc0100517 [Dactylellina cionopaga]
MKNKIVLDLMDATYTNYLTIEVARARDGSGIVEFETADDLRIAINKLDNYDFKGARVSCTSDSRTSRGRSRSPSPAGRRNGHSPREGRGYSPGRRGGGGYSPHRGDRGGYPPRGRGYSPPRGSDNRDRGVRERSPYGGGGSGRDDRRGGGGGGDYRNDRRFTPPYDRHSPDGYGSRSGGRYDEPRGGGRYDEPPRRDYDDKRGGYGGNEYGGPPARGGGGGGGGRSPPRGYNRDDYDRGPRSGGRY